MRISDWSSDVCSSDLSEKLCATTFDRFSSVSPGRRILVMANSFFPLSTGIMVQNGITEAPRWLLFIGLQVAPSSSETAWYMLPSGPSPAKTKSLFSPEGFGNREMVGKLRVSLQFSGTSTRGCRDTPERTSVEL